MKVLAAAGGTAGHVNPMLATADQLARRGHEVLAVGTRTGLEAELVPAAGLELYPIARIPLPRKPSGDLFRLPGRLKGAVDDLRGVLRDRSIDAVLGFGGYVSAPAYLAARQENVPVIVQEQNARPGIANKLGARWAKGVALTFEQTPLKAKNGMTRVTGLPLRAEISKLADDLRDEKRARFRREVAAARFGLNPDESIVLVTGGSSGAQRINTVFSQAGNVINSHAQVLHVTGKGKLTDIADGTEGERYRLVEYVSDMEEAYAIADLVVTRAGAGMVAELAALGIPAVVVPLPIGNGEQYLNAKSAIDSGAFTHISNDEFSPEAVRSAIVPLLDTAELRRRREILLASGVGNGASAVADLVEESM
ncbi:undecaprenyldiphospho-muramoylpentapeptide beta-N-acetylglucosaminyltransferase [Flaviflexus ciconiae]|uniref:UDP-N-acetylglucosamine--N-acetylmuramyl-(pentapeptide) pyrophosphoryl-undecaprenol N-acetylglucosamine transferase n=1 Tax=Flaviflexus ciconiae TaxID=2496867 RepID=A0A3S9PV27_9ACTO|nr:undecaprenyldiphospho-muramoylpentapeptide beta-N-acetylglucosaminyltransferase [Flaviflexus ciconiae]AZQ76221.1 undecaprenyldiphospho-muramoylpentapeptide beta-N-acetylglucosaminyltransferase [Flaviflexus ciconiae]